VAIQCHTDEHRTVQAIAVVAIILYPFGLFVLNAALLFSARDDIFAGKCTQLSQGISFLYREYKPHLYWWELVDMTRRFVLVGPMVLYQGTMMQLIVGTLISAAFLLLEQQAAPYKDRTDGLVASVASFCLLCQFMCYTVLKYTALTNIEDIHDKMSSEQQSLYILRGDTLVVLMALSVIGVVICSIAVLAYLLSVEAERLRSKLITKEETQILLELFSSRALSDVSIKKQLSASWLHSQKRLVTAVRALSQGRIAVKRSSSKFSGRANSDRFTTNTLITGQPQDAARGLSYFIGVRDPFGLSHNGIEKMAQEVKRLVESIDFLEKEKDISTEWSQLMGFAQLSADAETADLRSALERDVMKWFHYVLHETSSEKEYHNGIRDHGRGEVAFKFFVEHAIAQQAQLEPPHVFALRFYTTHAYKYLNGPLRSKMYGSGKLPHPLPVTMSFISDAIKKLRAAYTDRDKETLATHLWRGMRNMTLAESFTDDQQGGTEIAPMSTTTKFKVAAQYGASSDSLLFKLKVNNYLQLGADLQWLSAFPSEAEVCYPPLTYLEPTGKVQRVRIGNQQFKICEVIPHIP